jgi:hypothetical protein
MLIKNVPKLLMPKNVMIVEYPHLVSTFYEGKKVIDPQLPWVLTSRQRKPGWASERGKSGFEGSPLTLPH